MRRPPRSRRGNDRTTRRRKPPNTAGARPARPSKRGYWSCRFESLEDRLFLSVAPGIDKSALLNHDDLVRPVGSAEDYCEQSPFLPFGQTGVFSGGSQTQSALFNFTFDGAPLVEQVDGGVIVSLAGEQTWVSTGDPVVPVRQSTILLPQGMEITSIEVAYLDEGTMIASGVQLLAAPAAVPFGGGIQSVDGWSGVVSSSFGGQDAVQYANYTISGYNVGTLRVFPVEYDAAADTLIYHCSVSVAVTAAVAQSTDTTALRGLDSDRLRVAELVDNPEALDGYALPVGTSGDGSSVLPVAGQYEYVIVTSSALESSFQTLVDQKISRGLTARIVTTEYVYANYSGTETGDNADKIRHFLADAYANWGTQWVLLGGDTEVVPHRGVYAAVGSTVDNSLPTDMYYACLDGTWNGDGDALWGESNDGAGGGDVDLAPEVYIGRAPVSSVAEAANFVAKTVQYETTPHPNASTAVWLGEQLDDQTWGSYSAIPIRDRVMPADWDLTERYDSAGGWSGATFAGDLNASPNLVNHLGHANQTYNARLTNASVAALTNDHPYFMYSQGCMSGSFDTHNIAIAEQHVIGQHGAFGVVMNSRYGWYMPGSTPGASHYYAMEFWDAAFNEGLTHLGQANQDSKDDNLFRVGSTGVYRWIHFETNLFGDPETQFQLGGPAPSGEIHGAVWEDSNGDGQRQPEELAMAGQTVFLDLNGNGVLDAGTHTTASANVPLEIPDSGTVTSTLTVSGAALITDVNVTLDITHTYVSDLDVYLISPSGTRTELFSSVGGWGDDFTGTTLDDEAGTSITDAEAPFTGTFRPEAPLSRFDGEDANGTWTLEITDTQAWDVGTLNSWSLQIASEEPYALTGADGAYAFTGLDDGTYSVRHELPDQWQHTNPADGIRTAQLQGSPVVEGLDFLAWQGMTPPPATDLGQVDFLVIADVDLTGGDSWYSLQTTRQGYLTIEALFVGSSDDLELNLYDADLGELAASAVSEGGERIDWSADAGQTYYVRATGQLSDVDLRLANLVHQDGSHVAVVGTGGNDLFEFTAGSQHEVIINGVGYQFDSAAVNSVEFQGGSGNDAARLLGTAGADTVVMAPNRATLTGGSYQVVARRTGTILAIGRGGDDVARLYDSAGNDVFIGTPSNAVLYGAGFYNRASSFRYAYAHSIEGGADTARLYDSAGDDLFVATPEQATLQGNGFYNRATSFHYVRAYATGGGDDVARLYDSTGNDVFIGTPQDAILRGAAFCNRASFFRYAYAHAFEGGADSARLYDSAGDDLFVASPEQAVLSGDGFYHRATSFPTVRAYAGQGGTDVARLYDSPGDDVFVATPTVGLLYGSIFCNRAYNFSSVYGYATPGGSDEAKLYDSAGDDTFVATPEHSTLYGAGFYNRASSFGSVRAYAARGGADLATFYDSAGNDVFVGTPESATLYGNGVCNRAAGGGDVRAYATRGGRDTARLTDSALADRLEAVATWARLFNEDPVFGFSNRVEGFESVTAWSSNDEDVATIDPAALDWLVAVGWD